MMRSIFIRHRWSTFITFIIYTVILSVTACGVSDQKVSDKVVTGGAARDTDTGAATDGSGDSITGRDVSDVDGPALKDLYEDSFYMGAAINGISPDTAAIQHEGMANVLKKHYNSTTLSNLMKPVYLLDEDGCKKAAKNEKDTTSVAVKFDSCKESLDFCKENGIRMRGHTLIWHNQTPEWFFKKGYDAGKGYVSKKTMIARMKNYIKKVVNYCEENYPGVVYCWDVVNECVADPEDESSVSVDGWNVRTTFNDGDNFWYKTIGKDYAYEAFKCFREVAPDGVKAYYNDYNVFVPIKRDNIYKFCEKLKNDNLIDGIGLQPTVTLDYPGNLSGDDEDSFETCLREYAKLGLEIQVTELSFMIDEENSTRDDASLKLQADRYEEMFKLLKETDDSAGGSCNIVAVTVFGICDDYPLYDDTVQCLYLWDKECKPKEAFYRIREVGER